MDFVRKWWLSIISCGHFCIWARNLPFTQVRKWRAVGNEHRPKDLRGTVVLIADFLGRPLSDEAVERILNLSTLDSMKQRYNTADDKSGKAKIGAPGVIRKGIVGDWKTQFTVAQNEMFDKIFRDSMEGLDLHIDFEVKE